MRDAEKSYFQGKVAWVVGASSGIGRAMAIALARAGAQVVVSARTTSALLELKAMFPDRVQVLELDVQIESARGEIVEKLLRSVTGIDLFVYSSGLSQRSLAKETDLHTVRTLMEVNFFGAVDLTTSLLKRGLNPGAQLVLLSSVTGFVGTPKRSTYAATKHALHGYFNTLRSELKGTGIGVTLLCPGYVETGIDTRSLLGNGSVQRSPDAGRPRSFTADAFATRALRVIAERKEEAYIGGTEVAAIYLQRFFPALVSKISHRFSPDPMKPSLQSYRSNVRSEKKILLVPGLNSPMEVFAPLVTELEKQGLEVLTFNFPGRGQSTGGPEEHSLENLATMVRELLAENDWSGKPFTLVGFSWGVGVALTLALKQDLGVTSLRLIAPVGLAGAFPFVDLLMRVPVLSMRLLMIDFLRGFHRKQDHAAFIESFQQQLKRPEFRKAMRSGLRHTGLDFEALYRFLDEKKIKTHVIAGQRDHKFDPKLLELFAAERTTLLENGSHMLPLEFPIEVARALTQA